MANETSGAFFTANAVVDNTAAGTFIPEIWSDEIIAAYESNLVMANLVKKMSMKGKKGDTIHVPKPVRGSAAAKAEATAVTIQANLEEEVQISINRHFEYSRLIENITEVQALSSLRRFYTEDAGYALATQCDTDLLNCSNGLGDGGAVDLSPSDGTSWVHSASFYADTATSVAAYALNTVASGDDIEDAIVRAMIRKLDDADVPMSNRFWVVPPSAVAYLRGIDRFMREEFVGSPKVTTGKIGSLYGVDFYVSTNCPILETAAQSTTVQVRGSVLAHRDTFVLAEQMGVRSQKQRKQEYLADLYTADRLYGVQVMRPDAGFVLALPDA